MNGVAAEEVLKTATLSWSLSLAVTDQSHQLTSVCGLNQQLSVCSGHSLSVFLLGTCDRRRRGGGGSDFVPSGPQRSSTAANCQLKCGWESSSPSSSASPAAGRRQVRKDKMSDCRRRKIQIVYLYRFSLVGWRQNKESMVTLAALWGSDTMVKDMLMLACVHVYSDNANMLTGVMFTMKFVIDEIPGDITGQ